MTPILEPITAGLVVALINRFLIPRIAACFESPVNHDDREGSDSSDSSENSAINADTETHIHSH